MDLKVEWKFNWLHKFCINVLKSGPIPKHIAFIMDGNRRYAAGKGMVKIEAHKMGFKALSKCCQWCNALGISEGTLYMFSIENFKRPKEEVDSLMNLAEEICYELLCEKEKLNEYGVCIKLLGDIKYLPMNLQKIVAELLLYTRNNNKLKLNVCLAYTSKEEITDAVKEIALAVRNNYLKPTDINETLLNDALYSYKCTDPDLLIRTSGEIRLSDFLLWQSGYSMLSFLKVLWPDLKLWDLFLAILQYQHNYIDIKAKKENQDSGVVIKEIENDVSFAVKERRKIIESEENDAAWVEVSEILDQLDTRRKHFINYLDNKRYEEYAKILDGDVTENEPPTS